MSEATEHVRTFEGLSYLRLWARTLRQARKLVGMEGQSLERQKVRLRSLFGPLEKPVFILGCPRSGTTFLGEVLAALPSATYYFEPPAMKYYTRLIREKLVSPKQAKRFYQRGCRALLLAAPGQGKRLIEKNPNHTWVAHTLLDAFPDAQFIIISRDGRDIALSLSQKPWHLAKSETSGRREPGGYLYGPQPHFYIEPNRRQEFAETSDFHRCVWIWRQHAEEIERLRSSLPKSCQHHLDYEDLVSDPEAAMRGILNFIGENDRNSFESVMKIAKTGHRSSVGRWKKHFSESDLKIFEQEAGPLLSSLGYQETAEV